MGPRTGPAGGTARFPFRFPFDSRIVPARKEKRSDRSESRRSGADAKSRALFAQELLDSSFGSQAQIAEVLNVTRSAVSMSISVAKAVGAALARAIGPAHGVGRPRWEAFAKELSEAGIDQDELCRIARDVRAKAAASEQCDDEPQADSSVSAFDAVARHLRKSAGQTRGQKPRPKTTALLIDGMAVGAIKRSSRAVRLDLTDLDDAFAEWLDARAQDVLEELHERWKRET